jgi:Na+-translocating ferredoxin:NAD+ oxidoreductase RnfG subunit
MRRWQFLLLLVLGIVCICLSVVAIVFAGENQKLQNEIQLQQATINKGALSQQIGANLLREMAAVAQSDERMRNLLKDNGYNLAPQPVASPSP